MKKPVFANRMRCGVSGIDTEKGSGAVIAIEPGLAGRLSMHPSIRAFLDHLKTERNSSAHTIRGYEDDLGLFSTFLAEAMGEDADPTTVDSRGLRRYSAWLSGRGYAASTVARRLA